MEARKIKPSESVYTPKQLYTYLDVIGFSPRYGTPSTCPEATFGTLSRISRLHLLAFPFENIEMHYTETHIMDITPDGLYQNLVIQRRGRGSYCFGLNILLSEMLKACGFRLYTGLARRLQIPGYDTLSHMIIFVQVLDEVDKTYLVDATFRGLGLSRPILLAKGSEVIGTTPTERHRLIRQPHPESTIDGYKHWCLDVWHGTDAESNGADKTWQNVFSFNETEYFLRDYYDASYLICSVPPSKTSGVADTVMVLKYFVLDSDEVDILDASFGRIMLLGDKVRRTSGSESEVVAEMKTEEERIRAMREILGLQIEFEDAKYILGRVASLEK